VISAVVVLRVVLRAPPFHTREVAGSIPAAPIYALGGMRLSLNHAVRCVRDVRGVRRGAPTGAPTKLDETVSDPRVGADLVVVVGDRRPSV